MILPDDLDLKLPTDIPDWPPGEVPAEVWLAEQQKVCDALRNSPEYEERFKRKAERFAPFVWRD
jgi:hypothetical protein